MRKKLYYVSTLLILTMFGSFVMIADAQEELMGAPTFDTTQIFVRLTGPFDNDNFTYRLRGGENWAIFIDKAAPLFPDWRSRQLPLQVQEGDIIWSHVFLNIAANQAHLYENLGEVTFPFWHDGEPENNTPQTQILDHADPADPHALLPPVNEVDINGTTDFIRYPGNPVYNSVSARVFNLTIDFANLSTQLADIQNTGNPLTIYLGAVKMTVRQLPCGLEKPLDRTEVQPLDSPDLDELPDRISDAVVRIPPCTPPQIAYETMVKGHFFKLCLLDQIEDAAAGTTTSIFETKVYLEDAIQTLLGWNVISECDGMQLIHYFPHPPFMAFGRIPLASYTRAWAPVGFKTLTVDTLLHALYIEGTGLEVGYSIIAPTADAVDEFVYVVVYFLIPSGVLPANGQTFSSPIMIIDPCDGTYLGDASIDECWWGHGEFEEECTRNCEDPNNPGNPWPVQVVAP